MRFRHFWVIFLFLSFIVISNIVNHRTKSDTKIKREVQKRLKKSSLLHQPINKIFNKKVKLETEWKIFSFKYKMERFSSFNICLKFLTESLDLYDIILRISNEVNMQNKPRKI